MARKKIILEQETIVADIYIRNSKVRKKEKKISPETQEQICRDYIKSMGWKVGIVRYDPNKSGWAIHYTKRGGLMDILARAEEGTNHKVVVYKFSRLGRKYFDEICDRFEDLGVAMVSATEQIDVTTPAGRVFRSNIGAMNRFFAEETSEWQQDTKQTNAENGKFNGGNSFYGAVWHKKKKQFFNNEKSDIVLHLFRLKLAGIGCTQCMKKLHDDYTEFGANEIIYSPTGKEWWQETTIQYIWTNPRYIGLIPHNGLCYGGEWIKDQFYLYGEKYENWCDYLIKAHGLTSDEALQKIEDARGRHRIIPSPIIPLPLWNAVQEELNKSREKSSSDKASTHEFTGIMYDAHDMKTYLYRRQDENHPPRWLCSVRKLKGSAVCNSKIIDHDTFLLKLLEHIFQIALDDELWINIKHERASLLRAESKPLLKSRYDIEVRIAQLKETIRDVEIDRYEKRSISAEQFSRLNLKYHNELEQLQREFEKFDVDRTVTSSYKDIDNLKKSITYMNNVWDKLEDKERRSALSSIINKIMVYDAYVTVDLIFYSFDLYPECTRKDVMFF